MIDLRTYDDTLFRVDEVMGEKMCKWLKFDKRFFYEQDDFNRAFLAQTFDVEPSSQSLEETKELLNEPLKTYFFEGTFFTLQKALKSFYEDITLKQWQDYGGKPYHFKLKMTAGKENLSKEKFRKLDDLIENYKNVRSTLGGFEISLKIKVDEIYKGAAVDGEFIRVMPEIITNVKTNVGVYYGIITHELETLEVGI